MSKVPVIIEPAAKQDIRAARDYYTDKSAKICDDFCGELVRIFDLISRHPEAIAIALGATRLKPMRQFPSMSLAMYFTMARFM